MHILTQNNPIREEQKTANWLEILADAVSDPKELLHILELPIEKFEKSIAARQLFPLRVPRPFIEKMEKGKAYQSVVAIACYFMV